MKLPEIPRSWLIAIILVGMVVMRCFGIDSWTTAVLGILIGYLTGQHIEATTDVRYLSDTIQK